MNASLFGGPECMCESDGEVLPTYTTRTCHLCQERLVCNDFQNHIASNYQASPNVLQLLFFKKPDQLHLKVHIYHGCFTKLNAEITHTSTRFDKDCNNILFNIIIIDIRQQTGVSERSKICCLITYIYLTASIYHILYYLEQ